MIKVVIVEFDTEYEFNVGTELIVKLFQKESENKIYLGSFDIKFNRNECLKQIAYSVLNTIDKHNEIYLGCLPKNTLQIERILIAKGCCVNKISYMDFLQSLL